MKKPFVWIIGLLASTAAIGCGSTPAPATQPPEASEPATSSEKSLIVYFSRTGFNYPNPKGPALTVGHTARIAGQIAELTGGDLFEVVPTVPYPDIYDEAVNTASEEKKQNARPAMKHRLEGIENYTTIFIGYPIWWGTTPMIIRTFFDTYDLSGKRIIPFATHHGSGLGSSVEDIQAALPHSKVETGLAIWDTQIDTAKPNIESWLKQLELK